MYKGKVLSIAGSDPSGGAGIQADIKTITMLGCYAATCITSITAQNTLGVSGTWDLSADIVEKQLVSVLEDIEVDSVKIGMLPIQSIDVVFRLLPEELPVVLDPVMVSTSGHKLTDPTGLASRISDMGSKVTLITPNVDEAKVLSQQHGLDTDEEMVEAARKISKTFGIRGVLVKGAIRAEVCNIRNVLLTENGVFWFENSRVPEILHGTGCTLTAAIASFAAQGMEIEKSVELAFAYIAGTVQNIPKIGNGFNPVFHNHALCDIDP